MWDIGSRSIALGVVFLLDLAVFAQGHVQLDHFRDPQVPKRLGRDHHGLVDPGRGSGLKTSERFGAVHGLSGGLRTAARSISRIVPIVVPLIR